MWSIFGSKCVKIAIFCILQDYPWTDVDALTVSIKRCVPFGYKDKIGEKLLDVVRSYNILQWAPFVFCGVVVLNEVDNSSLGLDSLVN